MLAPLQSRRQSRHPRYQHPGQGCPVLADPPPQPNRSTHWAWLLLAALLVAAVPARAVYASDQTDTIRLRIAWGGGTAVQWAARLSIEDGELSDLALLGRQRDTPGSIWIENGSVLVAQPRPRTFDGVDVTARASLDSTLRIEMRAAGEQQPQIVELSLAELMKSQHRTTLLSAGGATQTTLLVHRAQADALRINTERADLVFQPGEKFQFDLEPALLNLPPGASLDLTAEVQRGRGGTQQWRNGSRITLPAEGYAKLPVTIPLPRREGVYTIKLAVRNPPGNRVKFWEATTGAPLASRSFQVLVLDEQRTGSYVQADWQTRLELDPANPKWWQRLPEWTRLDRLTTPASGPMGSEPSAAIMLNGKSYAKLSPSKAGSPSWQAYPLPAAEPGQPHMVEIELPAGYAQQLAVRIYEPDARGKLVANGPGSGVLVDNRFSISDSSGNQRHRYLFWPRSNSPVAVIQNASQQSPAAYGNITLRSAKQTTVATQTAVDDHQTVAAYFEWEALAQRTAARPATGRSQMAIDDLMTFYQMSERLAALLELSGYNAAVVNVMRDGGAAFDIDNSAWLPTLNSCRIASGANDLPAINPTDLMLRLFSRRGLRLTPTLRFNATLPQVEQNFRSQKYTSLEDYPIWTDLAGGPRRVTRIEDVKADVPHYLAIHPDVTSEVAAVVRRLSEQAVGYPSFAGIGLELSTDSYLATPPSRFGITGPRLARLGATTGTNQATVDQWIKQPQNILDDAELKQAWNTQRASAMTAMLESLGAIVQQANKNKRLLLLCPELLDSREYAVRPQAGASASLAKLYAERGLLLSAIQESDSLELPHVVHRSFGLPLVDSALGLELNRLDYADQTTQTPASVASWATTTKLSTPHGEAFELSNSLQHKITFDRLASHSAADLTRLLYKSAPGAVVMGGPLGPSNLATNENRLALRTLASLPAGGGVTTSSSKQQPVVTRVYRTQDAAIAVVANDSPWSVEATVSLSVSKQTTASPVTGGSSTTSATQLYAAGQHAWPIKLPAYGIRVVRFSHAEIEITGIQVRIAPVAAERLAAICTELEKRDLKPDQLAPYQPVANPSFEQTDNTGMATSWLGSPGVATVTPGVDGGRAAQLRSTQGANSIATQEFTTPATGEIAVTAYVKVLRIEPDARLRLIVEETNTAAAPRFIELTASQLEENQQQKEWNAYQFGVEDLPLDSTSRMRLRVELTGNGEVWVDNFQVHELVYPLRIYPKESDQQVLALVQHVKATREALNTNQLHDCLELIESYRSRFLLKYLPEIKAPTATLRTQDVNAASETAPATPRLSDRMRDWFRF